MQHTNTSASSVPADGLRGLTQNWKADLLSGFMVFLIALPLSLGISIASGAPPIAGIISAFVGGLVVSVLSGSHLTINGPAAGLIVIVLGAIETLGQGDLVAGYYYTLAAIVVAGALLLLAGWLKAGRLADFFPLAAVHGMLAAIGILIIAKQVHIMLGVKPEGKEPLELLAEIPHSLMHMNPKVALVGLLSLAVLIFLHNTRIRVLAKVPAPVVAVAVGVIASMLMDLRSGVPYFYMNHEYQTGTTFFVNLPDRLLDALAFPDFSIAWTAPVNFLIAAVSIALIQGLESLLSASAVDQLDPYKRKSNLNKDLAAVGTGSMVAGMLGGLPMIAEIVRSSANVNNGGKTRWANFFHGLFVLLSVLLIPDLIGYIPMATLAAMLVFTGYRLASPKEFGHMLQISQSQFIVFVVTLVGVLATDLLIGIGIGMLTKIGINQYFILKNAGSRTKLRVEKTAAGHYHIRAGRAIVFTNFLAIKNKVAGLPPKSVVTLDFQDTVYLDHTSNEHLLQLRREFMASGGQMEFRHLEHLVPMSLHPAAPRIRANPHHTPATTQETDHLLRNIAEQEGLSWTREQPYPDPILKKFPSMQFEQVLFEENILHGPIGYQHANVKVFDAVVRSHDRLKGHVSVITCVLITQLPFRVPVFTLEQEHPHHQWLSMAGLSDINFPDFPIFSARYLLAGRNEAKIRAFFHPGLLAFLESTPPYHVESDGTALLLHAHGATLAPEQTVQMLAFARALLQKMTDSTAMPA